jgi:hypothetical protein
LKQVKANCNWGDNIFTVIARERTMAMNTFKYIPLKPSKRLNYIDDGYDLEEGLLNEKEEQLYNVVPKLWHVRKVALKELYLLKEIDYGMLQLEEKPKDPIYFYKHQPREVLIFDETIDVTIKDKKIVGWTVATKEQLMKFRK